MTGMLTESKNLHMEHLEDNILNGGVDGTRQTINFLRALRDMLSGNSKSSMNVSVKWDGAPSIFAGTDPSDGKFFVAKKGIFNKNPKIYKTSAEIDADLSGDLADKFKTALRHLPSLKIDGIVQGDFLFTKNDLRTQTINGEKYVTFHPNTIVYAIPVDSDLGRTIRRAKMGVVWHTKYVGNSFEDLKAMYNQSFVDVMRPSTNVWFTDAVYRDVSGAATMTSSETAALTSTISTIGKLFNKVSKREFNYITKNDDYLIRLKTYINSKIREGEEIRNAEAFVDDFIVYLNSYMEAEIAKRKTDRGKEGIRTKIQGMIENVDPASLTMIMRMYSLMVRAKKMLINKLNKASGLDTFILTNQGFRVTNQEGFVVADKLGANAVKLVDRLEFSYSNFSKDVIKGFDR